MPVDVVVIDDQTIFRELVVALLEADSKWTVTGQFETGREGIKFCLDTRPKVVVLDVILPDMSGLDVLKSLRAHLRRTHVMVVTAHARHAVVQDAVSLGANAILSKAAPLSEFRLALDRVAAGGTYYCSHCSQVLRENALQPPKANDLTGRQREILQRVARGRSTKDIASELGLSPRTVSNHRLQIMQRLGLHDIASLTRYAVERGLVEPAAGGSG